MDMAGTLILPIKSEVSCMIQHDTLPFWKYPGKIVLEFFIM